MPNESPTSKFADAARGAAPTGLPWNVRILGLASLLNDVAGEMIYPLIPTFLISVLGGTTSQLGGVEGAAETVASLVKLWSGGLSDRAGKRKVFVTIGYALTAFSRPFIAWAAAPWQVLLIRASDRFGKGIRSAPRDALVADSTDPAIRGRAFGFTRAMDHLGAAIGPLLAFAFLGAWPEQFRTLFLLAAIPGLLVVLLVLFGLRERSTNPIGPGTAVPELASRDDKRFQLTLRPFDRNFRVYLVALVIFTLGNSSDAFLLVRVGELGVPTTQLPLLWCAFHVVKSTLSVVAGRVVDHLGPRPLIFV
ncbi:MAG TPA: MFS transporter, partial [Pirellulales bacterium]|nr:MFS transporter [Pirellulales bacterium]